MSNQAEDYPMGIIAGGMMDGTVHLFDPYRMMMNKIKMVILPWL
jgi:hypothetical protein